MINIIVHCLELYYIVFEGSLDYKPIKFPSDKLRIAHLQGFCRSRDSILIKEGRYYN